MRKSRHTEGQIAMALRQGEAGTAVEEICRKMGIAEATYFRWKKKYGGLGISELREFRQVREENRRLKGIVADLTLGRTILQEALRKNGKARAAPSGRSVGRVFVPGVRVSRMPASWRESVDDPISEPKPEPGADGSCLRVLTAVDTYTRECVALHVERSFSGADVGRILENAGKARGTSPQRIRVDNGRTEFTSKAMDAWAYWNHVELVFSRPGKPVDNAFAESLNATVRRECLSRHWFQFCDFSGFVSVRGLGSSGPVPGRGFQPQAAMGPFVVVVVPPPSKNLLGVPKITGLETG